MADKQPADDLELGEEKKGKGKLFLIIGIVAVLLIGGGAAAFFLMGGEEPAEGEAAKVEEEAEPVDKGPALYYEMQQFVATLPPGNRYKMLQAKVSLYTHSQELVDFMTANDPMFRHHLLNLLSSQNSKDLLGAGGREALQAALIDKIREILKQRGQEKLGDEIEGLFFTSFVMQ